MKTLIIAEAGVNHNGDLVLAKKLVEVAAQSGADIVKFQTFKASTIATRSAQKAAYQTKTTKGEPTQYNMLQKLELTEPMHIELIACCAQNDIQFLSTGFDIESVDLLEKLGQALHKIPSGEITNLPYLRHIGALGKPVILSTGMSTMAEIEAAVSTLEHEGTSRDKITVLHCTTEYPTPMDEVNLNAMRTIATQCNTAIGYSDHTKGIEIAIAAVALGACVIEKHFTLDCAMEGPDHKASLEPDELAAMIASIRNIEQAMGDGDKRPTQSEAHNITAVRKSLVAQSPIEAGDIFTTDNITAKRPASGLSPMLWDDVIGRTAPHDFAIDEMIEL